MCGTVITSPSPDIFERQTIASRYFLLGLAANQPEYYKVLDVMEKASKYHVGTRRDGEDEFSHQMSIFLHLRTYHTALMYPARTYCAIFGHDVYEDYGTTKDACRAEFGEEAGNDIILLSKMDPESGIKLTNEQYYDVLARCPVLSVAKGGDRCHNNHSMPGAFTYEKMQAYLTETEQFVLPMLKEARRRFPQQEAVYEGIKYMLRTQIKITEHFLVALALK